MTEIRESRPGDRAAIQHCIAVLQDSECTFDPRLRPGHAMADAYLQQLLDRGRDGAGAFFVADDAGAIVGLVSVLVREPFTSMDEPPGTFALITDLIVLPSHRRLGVGRALLERAEALAWASGAPEVRIYVRPRNTPARDLYMSLGFAPYVEALAKRR